MATNTSLEAEVNLDRESRGVDRIAGELLCAVPDVGAAISRIEAIEASMTHHLEELIAARRAENLAVLALKADAELLAEEMGRDRRDWNGRREEIEAGAADLGLQMPRLGFRIVKPLPEVAP